MRWFADECVAARLVASLRAGGHDVIYGAEVFPSTNDLDVLNWARDDRRLLLTEDRDFGELIFGAAARGSAGVVFLRIRDESAHLAWPRLQTAIEHFGDQLFGTFTVVEENRFRVRSLSP